MLVGFEGLCLIVVSQNVQVLLICLIDFFLLCVEGGIGCELWWINMFVIGNFVVDVQLWEGF